tara:strand:- start:57 stop:554 length:498 start_codon:yes stop_codon:yes gene_type:complete
MKKTFVLCLLFTLLNNCGNWEFVHKTNKFDYIIKDATNIIVSGNDSSSVYNALVNTIGDKEDEFPNYQLSVNSIKKESAEVIGKDATATKFSIKYSISYDLYNLYKECNILNKEVSTIGTYNAQSEGHSFGTDLSQKESSEKIIERNINEFLFFLNSLSSIDSCN